MTTTKKTSVIDRYKSKVKAENKQYIAKNLQISNQICEILDKKGLTQKSFAQMLEKHESEVSKLLSGLHNITLKSIAKMETVLNEDIVLTPIEACRKYSKIEYVTLKVSANKNSVGTYKNKFIHSKYKSPTKEGKAA